MNDEWLFAAAICAVPFLIFGLVELVSRMRHRRLKAIARRPKAITKGRSDRSFGRAD